MSEPSDDTVSMESLKREASEWRSRCEQAGVLGSHLVLAKQRLEGENAELEHRVVAGEKRVDELMARVKALQDQLGDAEALNRTLTKDLTIVKDDVRRSARLSSPVAFGDALGRQSGADGGPVVSKSEFDALKEKLDAALERAERAEARQAVAQSLGHQLDTALLESAQLKALSESLEEKWNLAESLLKRAQDELQHHDAAALAEMRAAGPHQADLKWIQDLDAEGLRVAIASALSGLDAVHVETAYEGSREGLWATLSLVHWRAAVLAKQESATLLQQNRALREEKELVEEKLASAAQNGGLLLDDLRGTLGLEAEALIVREKEEARRAIEALRSRTAEAEEAQRQCQLAVKEANRLRQDLVIARAAHQEADRKLVQAEIEAEIWRERGARTASHK